MPCPRCPRCGFSFAWNGRRCGHCPPPDRARLLWESISYFAEQVNATKPLVHGPLLPIAGGCLRQLGELLPEALTDVTQALELGSVSNSPPLGDFGPDATRVLVRAINPVLIAANRNSAADLFAAVSALALACRRHVGNRMVPHQNLLSFPLPPHLEHHRASIERELQLHPERVPLLSETHPARPAYDHLMNETEQVSRRRWRFVDQAEAAQCAVARDVLGYPEVTVAFDPAWRTSTAVAMAKGFIEAADFSAMPILADALQDAGCDDPEVLEHCRSDRGHYRGCWVVERVLGRG